MEDFRWNGHDHEKLVVFWEAQNLPVEGVGSGQGMGEGPGAEGRVADVAFCPPGAKAGVPPGTARLSVNRPWAWSP